MFVFFGLFICLSVCVSDCLSVCLPRTVLPTVYMYVHGTVYAVEESARSCRDRLYFSGRQSSLEFSIEAHRIFSRSNSCLYGCSVYGDLSFYYISSSFPTMSKRGASLVLLVLLFSCFQHFYWKFKSCCCCCCCHHRPPFDSL